MKKTYIFVLVIFITTFLFGCSSGSQITLTEDEKNAIAQYSAYLLMKYDTHGTVDEKLLDKSDLQKKVDAIAAEEEKAAGKKKVTPVPDKDNVSSDSYVETTPELKSDDEPSKQTGGITSAPEASANSDSSVQTDAGSKGSSSGDASAVSYTLAEAIGVEEFELTYSSFSITDSYKGANEYFSLTPPKGKHLALVHLNLKNTTKQSKTLDASTLSVNYYLKCISNSGSSYTTQSVPSLLEDDLQYYYRFLTAGETRDVVLVFYIEDGFDSYIFSAIGDPTSSDKRVCNINLN